jgi:hypothetical protein
MRLLVYVTVNWTLGWKRHGIFSEHPMKNARVIGSGVLWNPWQRKQVYLIKGFWYYSNFFSAILSHVFLQHWRDSKLWLKEFPESNNRIFLLFLGHRPHIPISLLHQAISECLQCAEISPKNWRLVASREPKEGINVVSSTFYSWGKMFFVSVFLRWN